MSVSALTQITRLNIQLNGILTALDIDIIGRETGKTIARIKQLSGDVRLDIRDWEMADSRAEMDKYCRAANKRLDDLRAAVLKASEHGIFNAIDVIDLSAQIEGIQAELKSP